VCWLVHRKQRLFKHAPGWQLLDAAGVNPERVIATERAVKRWRRDGALISVWTVNDPLEAERLAALGVDALISDVPGRLVSALS
jgi:glycerophosphoryl diester phosphodiesterase